MFIHPRPLIHASARQCVLGNCFMVSFEHFWENCFHLNFLYHRYWKALLIIKWALLMRKTYWCIWAWRSAIKVIEYGYPLVLPRESPKECCQTRCVRMCDAKAEYRPGIFKDHSPSEQIIDPRDRLDPEQLREASNTLWFHRWSLNFA